MSNETDERENMTQEEWNESRSDLERHLKGVENRFWETCKKKLLTSPAPHSKSPRKHDNEQ